MKRKNWLALTAGLVAMAFLILFLLALPQPPANAQHTPNFIPDPCFSQFTVKSSASVSIASATTTSIVAVVAGKGVLVCGFILDIQGSATTVGTAQFEYGTGAACSSPTALTGAMPGNITASVPTVIVANGDGTEFSAPASNGLCIVTTGTTVNVTGYVQYVQQ
jgi:hypothetical protein